MLKLAECYTRNAILLWPAWNSFNRSLAAFFFFFFSLGEHICLDLFIYNPLSHGQK